MNTYISIIIPLYNRAGLIGRAIKSVLRQTHVNFELLIVDDGSADEPASTIQSFADERIRYIRQPHGGVSAARNRGVTESRYPLIAFLDSDDEWLPNKLERQYTLMRDNNAVRICYTGESWIRNGNPFPHRKSEQKFSGDIFEQCLNDCFIGCSTVMMEKALFMRAGMFSLDFPVCEDYDLWLRIAARSKIYYINEPLILKYGGHDDQLSRQYWGLDRYRLEAIRRILASGILTDQQRRQAVDILLKKCAIVVGGSLKRKRYDAFSLYFSIWREQNLLEQLS
ncbi:MAG: glycosyltransferase family A protein [Candidatus Auribacterota bacterium]